MEKNMQNLDLRTKSAKFLIFGTIMWLILIGIFIFLYYKLSGELFTEYKMIILFIFQLITFPIIFIIIIRVKGWEDIETQNWKDDFIHKPFYKYPWQIDQKELKFTFSQLIELLQEEEFEIYYLRRLFGKNILMVKVEQDKDVDSLLECAFSLKSDLKMV